MCGTIAMPEAISLIPMQVRRPTGCHGPTSMVRSLDVDIISPVDTLPATGDHKKADKRLERLGGHGLNQAMACARLSNCIREQSAAQMEQITGRTVEKTVPTELVPHRLKVHIWMAGG
ncbi:hypothetical protein ACKVWC_003516 [Pyricularia oryzae]|nr:hypothetical protein MCOR16_004112 [Pyricularia oryzae]